jgi:anti-sigma factor RsiW
MSCHDQFQIEIPAYVASRLAGVTLSRMEEHLRGCDECREITLAWKEIVPALREGGESVFEEHPLEMALRGYALSETPHGGAIARHIEGCASCKLEVQFWASRERPAEQLVTPANLPSKWALPQSIWSAAAGLLIGVGIGYLMLAQVSPPGAGRGAFPDGTPGVVAISGRIPQVVLPRPVRGEGVERQVWIGPADRNLIVAAQLDLPGDRDDGERYRFAIEDHDGRLVWSTELDSATIRADLEANEVVSFVVPTEPLSAGRYTFVSVPAATSGTLNALSRATIMVKRSED